MIVKVDYEELDKVKKTTVDNGDALQIEIDKLLNSLDELKEIWIGDDSDAFYKNAYDFISRMKVLPAFQSALGDFMTDASKQYSDNDKSFSNKLKREAKDLEENSNFRFNKIREDNTTI